MDIGNYSPGLILALVLSVAMAPYVAVMITAFTKLVVVFSLLRNALGLQQTPPNVVLNGLAIILSVYMMYPIGIEISEIADQQFQDKDWTEEDVSTSELMQVANQAKEPLRQFLIDHTNDKERAFFTATAKKLLPEDKRDRVSNTDLTVIIPAFTVSELSRAFPNWVFDFLALLGHRFNCVQYPSGLRHDDAFPHYHLAAV